MFRRHAQLARPLSSQSLFSRSLKCGQGNNRRQWVVAALSASLLAAPLADDQTPKWSFLRNSKASFCAAAKETEEVDLGPIEQFVKGEMYDVKIFGGKQQVLVTNIEGTLYCTGNSCSHYSAPLHRGIATKELTVACPWHDAEFSLITGDCVNGPALKGIPVFPIEVRDDHVFIRVPKEAEFEDFVDMPMAKRDPQNNTTFGIVGAGAAALAAAETLRKEGFTGRILMFGQEAHPPYDRPVLSKNLQAKIGKITLRSAEWLEQEATVEFLPNTQVTKVDTSTKTITTASGKEYKCDKILLATGGSPRRLPIPGTDLKNVEVLRSYEDAERLAAWKFLDVPVVVIGSSFIGMEIAATMGKAGARVTVIGMESVPFERVFGERVGKQMQHHVNQKRVVFKGNQSVVKLHGSGGKVSGVELANGDILQADLVVLGVGVVPNTDYIEGVKPLPDRSIHVDPFMQVVGSPGVYAAGDIATFPYYKTGEDIRVEHWDVAMSQGRTAAKHMTGKMEPYNNIPFFWTMLLGKSIRYAGHCVSPDNIVIEGNTQNMEFAALYVKGDEIQAIATCGMDPAAIAAIEGMKHGLLPSHLEYELGFFNTKAIVQIAKRNVGKDISE